MSPDCWVAFHYDFSEVVVFRTEIEALRYALDNHMHVKRVKFGVSLRKQVGAK